MTPDREFISLDRVTRDAIADIVAIPHAMPAAPFGSVRALWLCRANGCAEWNTQDRRSCRRCNNPRTET